MNGGRTSIASPGSAAWKILGAALTVQLGLSIVDQGIPTLTGFIKADLNLSAAMAGVAVSSFGFGRILGSYAAGLAADRLGERRVLLAGGIVTGILVGCAVAAPLGLLFALLVVGGTTSAAGTPAGGRLVLGAFPPERRGLALGIRQCGIPLGGLVAAALLPRIAHDASWRWSLAVAGGASILFALPLISAPSSAETGGRAVSGVRVRNRNIVVLTAWGCLVVTGQYAILAFFALDLHASDGLSLATASLYVAFANACGIAGRLLWGAVSDRLLVHGRKPLLWPSPRWICSAPHSSTPCRAQPRPACSLPSPGSLVSP